MLISRAEAKIDPDTKTDNGTDSDIETDRNESQGSESRTDSGSSGASLEKALYEELVQAGGRPCYPVEMLDYVRHNPRTCHEVLQPWVYYVAATPHGWKVLLFERQLLHW